MHLLMVADQGFLCFNNGGSVSKIPEFKSDYNTNQQVQEWQKVSLFGNRASL